MTTNSRRFSALSLTLALLVLVAAAPAAAQRRDDRPRAGQMDPTASPEVRGMASLLGEWRGSGTFEQEGQRANIQGRWSCAATSGGHGVRCNLVLPGLPGMDRYEETDLMGYNAADRLYHWYSVTNAGEVHDHAGSCDGTVTTFQYQGFADGKLLVERITFTTVDARTMRIHATTTVGSQALNAMDITITKS